MLNYFVTVSNPILCKQVAANFIIIPFFYAHSFFLKCHFLLLLKWSTFFFRRPTPKYYKKIFIALGGIKTELLYQ